MAKGTVCIVEDDDCLREALRLFLSGKGYAVLEAANGQEALELLEGLPAPDLILLDLSMPVMDGEAFLTARSARPGIASVPVLLCSGAMELPPLAPDARVWPFSKPYSFRGLLQQVERLCPPRF